MKLSNGKLLNSVDSLTTLNTLKLPVKTSFKVAKMSKTIDGVLKTYYEVLGALQDEHAEKDDEGEKLVDGTRIKFKDPKAFQDAYNELLECESDLQLEMISVEDFGSVDVEPQLLYHLDWLLKE